MPSPLRFALAASTLLTVSLACPRATACLRDMPEVVPSGHVEPRTPAIALREADELVDRSVETLPLAVARVAEARAMLEADPEHPLAEDVIRDLPPAERRAKTARLLARGDVIEQLARSRSPGASDAERAAAAATITRLAAEHESLVTEATVAEVLARVPAHEKEATARFASLAKRDLLGSPWENAAYANLAARSGEERTERDQRWRCRQLTSRDTTHGICDAPAGAVVSARVAVASAGGASVGVGVALTALLRRARARRRALLSA